MRYFKNIELAKIYKVSEKTIGNWIDATRKRKIDLQLYNIDDRYFILNNSHNHSIMQALAAKGKKFKNKKASKVLSPKEDFYKIFNENHVIDIICNIESYKEIPYQYSYFDKGAEAWDKYINKLAQEETPSGLTNTIQLLDSNKEYIFSLIKSYEKVNFVDMGPGNGLPVKSTLDFLISKGLLGKYIGIDVSKGILHVAERNFRKWFGKGFPFEGHIRNFNFDRFQDILFQGANSKSSGSNSINLIAFLGGTAANQRLRDQPFHIINTSMSASDLLIYTFKLDSEKSRMYFDFGVKGTPKLHEQGKELLELLGITEDLYDVEAYFDKEKKSRIVQIVLKADIEIEFETKNFSKTLSLCNRDKIILMRVAHQNYFDVIQQFLNTGFEVLHTSRSQDQEQLLVIAKVKLVENQCIS